MFIAMIAIISSMFTHMIISRAILYACFYHHECGYIVVVLMSTILIMVNVMMMSMCIRMYACMSVLKSMNVRIGMCTIATMWLVMNMST